MMHRLQFKPVFYGISIISHTSLDKSFADYENKISFKHKHALALEAVSKLKFPRRFTRSTI